MKLILDLTKRCNMRCPGCIYLLYDRNYFTNDDMTLEDAQAIIQHFANNGVSEIYLTAEGEISLIKFLPELIQYINSLNMRIILNTNGLILTDALIELLLTQVKVLYISLDGYDSDTYKKHRGVDGFDKVVANLTKLVNRKKAMKSRCFISVAYVAYEERLEAITTMIELAQAMGLDRIEFYNFHQPLGQTPGFTPLTIQSLAVRALYNEVLSSTRYTIQIALPVPLGIEHSKFYCENLYDITVGTKKNLSPCCRIPPDPKYGIYNAPTPELLNFKTNLESATSLSQLESPCRKCQGLNPKTFIFSPPERAWKERLLIDGVEVIQDFRSLENYAIHMASAVVHNEPIKKLYRSLDEKEAVIRQQRRARAR